jgi:hypothetical protein
MMMMMMTMMKDLTGWKFHSNFWPPDFVVSLTAAAFGLQLHKHVSKKQTLEDLFKMI